jgi:gamma-glutamylputrescine oxidase
MAKFEVFWYSLRKPEIKKPQKNYKSDVLIIGGGMTGLVCAWSFAQRGKSVVLLEKDFCGAGASGKSSGFITPDSELELSTLLSDYGPQRAREIWEFVCSGVELIKNCIEKYNLKCDYQLQDSLFAANAAGKIKKIKEEYRARQKLNYAVNLHQPENLAEIITAKNYYGAVSYPGTFGICSYLFCQEFKTALENLGVNIFEASEVTGITEEGAMAAGHNFQADAIIFCGDRFIPEFGKLRKEIYHGQTFLAVSKPLQYSDVKKIFPGKKFMVWDTDLIYQYYRITGDNRLLIGGGDIISTYAKAESSPARTLKKLQKYISKKFPNISIEIEYIWPGLIGVTKDFLPVIYRDKKLPKLYFVGAGAGLPWSAAIGKYACEKIIDGRSELDEYFMAERFSFSNKIQSLIGTRLSFAIFQGLKKLF